MKIKNEDIIKVLAGQNYLEYEKILKDMEKEISIGLGVDIIYSDSKIVTISRLEEFKKYHENMFQTYGVFGLI